MKEYTIVELGLTRKYKSGMLWRFVQAGLKYKLPKYYNSSLCRIRRKDNNCNYAASGEYEISIKEGNNYTVIVNN